MFVFFMYFGVLGFFFMLLMYFLRGDARDVFRRVAFLFVVFFAFLLFLNFEFLV